MKLSLSSTLRPLHVCPLHVCPVLTVIFALIPVLKAEIHSLLEVSGYVGQEVLLPCRIIPGQENEKVTLAQWDRQASGVNNTRLVVHGVNVNTSQTSITEQYKNKLELKEYSLVIKNLDIEDAGVYICSLATFPGGSFQGRTKLVVNKQMPLSAGVVSAIVISVALLLGIIAATLYFIVIRRCPPSSRNHISIDTQDAVRDPSRPSLIKREDVVYADVELKLSNHNRVRSLDNHATYSEVNVKRPRRDEPVYAQVMKI